jgi:hypothetical protein
MPRYPTDHARLEILPFDECLRLLASIPVGRAGFVADGEVVVLPVNHVVDGQDVIFRTAHGSKAAVAGGQDRAASEPITMTSRPGPGGACWSMAAQKWWMRRPTSSA